MLNHVTIPTGEATGYEALAQNDQKIANDYLDDAQTALNRVADYDSQREHYLKLEAAAGGGGDVAQAYVDIIADTQFAYHYKVLAVDSYGRVTRYLSGNGLVTEDSYDDSGAMITSQTGYNGEASIRDLTYEYDSLYNLEQRTDKFLGVTSMYIYDELSRIENANFVFSSNGSTTSLENMTYRYDAYGNIKNKSDIGEYFYDDEARPNRLTRAGSKTFEYDANGNMLRNDEINLSYNAANKTDMISSNSGTTYFNYDMNNNRYQKITNQGQANEETTTYIGKVYEHIEKEYGFYEDKYFIYAEGKVIAVNSENHANQYESSIRYLHHDALGSVDAITNSQGEVVQRSAYKPFGERITLEQKAGERSITNRGYTGHEEIEGTRLVHMNARLYDPTLGRFLSADTLIQDPYDTQSYNRYSYVRNNPLKYTDPSGHSFTSVIKALMVAIVTIVVTVATLGAGTIAWYGGYFAALGAAKVSTLVAIGVMAGFAGSFTGALLSGASPGQALVAGIKGAVIGGLSAGVAHSIGTAFIGKAFPRAIAHGVTRGVIARLQGGNFSNGFMSGLASSAFGNITKGLTNITNYAKAAMHALVGGTVSAIGGGKFANGAVSGAVVYLFNDMNEGHGTYSREDESNLVKDWLTGKGSKMRVFGPENSMTKDLSTDPAIEYFKNEFLSKYGSIGDSRYYPVTFGITDFFFSNTNTLANIGSYGLSIYQTGSNELTYVIANDMGFNSFTAGIFPNINSGSMSTVETWFWWKGSVK